MLHQETLDPATLELLKSLQVKEYMKGFHLVGGTALALYYGHRRSIDIDLFTNQDFDTAYVQEKLIHDFAYQLSFSAKQTLKGTIAGVAVDILAHKYSYLQKPQVYEDLRILSKQDIIAMKLNAITISGQRSKDFIDVYYALDDFSIAEMLSFYKKKYNQQNVSFVLKSLTHFAEVDLSDWPVLIKEPNLNWEKIKEEIKNRVLKFINKEH